MGNGEWGMGIGDKLRQNRLVKGAEERRSGGAEERRSRGAEEEEYNFP
ncbi:MAG: hypothetical protein F6K41_42180 [Symploca sp. SIO3E6]|nr:hypothetical protein [Caldora sp. SIO3E6]